MPKKIIDYDPEIIKDLTTVVSSIRKPSSKDWDLGGKSYSPVDVLREIRGRTELGGRLYLAYAELYREMHSSPN